LFNKHIELVGITILLVYVDDIIVICDNEEEKQLLSQHLDKEFQIKTLEKLDYFLGFEVAHSKKVIFISQQKFIIDLLKESGKITCKLASILIPKLKLKNVEEDNVC